MQKVQENHIFGGVQRDLSVSKQPIQFLYDAWNIRLTAREKDTLMSITNERGTKLVDQEIRGSYVGHCLLNQYLVLFTTDSSRDYILRVDLSNADNANAVKVLYGSYAYHHALGFSLSHPIEAIGSYESEAIQKVYWTDGKNQPRMINIAPGNDSRIMGYNEYSFDFVPTLQLKETVRVSRLLGSSGEFPSGVIQYAFTYFNRYGTESNIFYTSPLRFIAPIDRGASPEEKVSASFQIEVTNVDPNFDFLRIYSIMRTSLNATPFCKRVADIEIGGIKDSTVTYVDTGFSGDTVDPTELLYKGGEEIKAGTIEQKDNTLFLGNICITRPQLLKELKSGGYYDADSHKIAAKVAVDDTSNAVSGVNTTSYGNTNYDYFNQLSAENSSNEVGVPCGGFMRGNTYRCGVQFQYKSGAWSNPFYIDDLTIPDTKVPYLTGYTLWYPRLEGSLSAPLTAFLRELGYVKARAVVVFPEPQDRKVICQGVVCPTVYTNIHRDTDKDLLAQSSWFFRPKRGTSHKYVNGKQTVSPWSETGTGTIPYTKTNKKYNPSADLGDDHPYGYSDGVDIRQVEVDGFFPFNERFRVDWSVVTMHSPEVEFNEQIYNTDFSNTQCAYVGNANFGFTLSDIDIQTETPAISSGGNGFVHKSFKHDNSWGICAGLFYDDYAVNDNDENLQKWGAEKSAYKWMVYPWQRTGSLNNDINRPSNKGTATAILKKKVISNLRYARCSLFAGTSRSGEFQHKPELFSSDEVQVVKIGNTELAPNNYYGNVDVILNSGLQGRFFAFDGDSCTDIHKETTFNSTSWWKVYGKYNADSQLHEHGIYKYGEGGENDPWSEPVNSDIGSLYEELVIAKSNVRMKYKSTPHLVFKIPMDFDDVANSDFYLPIVDIRRKSVTNPFGGTSIDALKSNVWIPCGKPVLLGNKTDSDTGNEITKFNYNYGDTYYQRWDCLKTYPFTREDENQIVEIGSFMLETYVNIDGRYDRNRGQQSNINMSPTNFNLVNPVYSQKDNFFSYRIMDEDFYTNIRYPNQITWTKEKSAGADIDLWTNITLASTYDMDGSKGEITSLNTWKDQIYCFQNKGVSNILFNSRVQIPVSDGVPIEISNSYKVDGYRYISDGIGCDRDRLVKVTPSGIYFLDSVGGHLFHIGDGLTDLSEQCNMTTLFKDNGTDDIECLSYDDINHDVYVVYDDRALCFSEKLNQFTGWYDYGNINFIETYDHHVFTLRYSQLWKMFEGDYCNLFGLNAPWELTFISNGLNEGAVNLDKIFTNMEFRASVDGDGELDDTTGKFTPALPFDFLETWNEYQHGFACLKNLTGHAAMQHHADDGNSSLKRKFRIWRCDVPRNNCLLDKDGRGPDTPRYSTDSRLGISRLVRKPMDRMRNPWIYLKLRKEAAATGKVLPRTEIHDLVMTYFV